jgi:hypothetical protein
MDDVRMVVEQLNFHRRDDPSNEHRELQLFRDGSHFGILAKRL